MHLKMRRDARILLVTRFPGGIINSAKIRNLTSTIFRCPLTKMATLTNVEGKYQSWDIITHEGVSHFQVFRNFQNAFKTGGFIVDDANSPVGITAHKGKTWIYIDNKGTYYYQTIVAAEEMKQEVTADASSLKNEIEKTGHVAVYGIHFDTGKATILADPETLKQVADLLQENGDLKLRVEGHTDNQGNAAANQAFTEKRAQAVVAWLTAKGIQADRLKAQGFGRRNRLRTIASEEGRAKNRRVELAKM